MGVEEHYPYSGNSCSHSIQVVHLAGKLPGLIYYRGNLTLARVLHKQFLIIR